jgi:hypothetical protein
MFLVLLGDGPRALTPAVHRTATAEASSMPDLKSGRDALRCLQNGSLGRGCCTNAALWLDLDRSKAKDRELDSPWKALGSFAPKGTD